MDFELSDDQVALQEAARDLLDGHADPVRVRAHLASGRPHDPALWSAMVEQGWLGITVPEEAGGLGLGWIEAAVLLEEIGRHTAPAPFLPTLLVLTTLIEEASGSPWIEPLLNGEITGCVAWAGADGAITESDGRLTGRTDPVTGATGATVALVSAPSAVYAVDLAAVGAPASEPAMDETRTLSWLELADTPAVRIGGAGAAQSLRDRAAVGLSAEMLGGAARVLEMTAQYAKDRIQFGQPIGSFQAVKHRCADMVVDVEGMRSTAWYGAWAIAFDDPDASLAASSAKVWCSDASRRVMASGLQVHGGIGFTWEHALHLYLKRAQLDQTSFGDASYHRDRIAAILRDRVRAGRSVI
jgi:alkylation response protein AidB-like acyl-CoA dehydrogenase